eukprot:719543-Amphidinium_carterae.3
MSTKTTNMDNRKTHVGMEGHRPNVEAVLQPPLPVNESEAKAMDAIPGKSEAELQVQDELEQEDVNHESLAAKGVASNRSLREIPKELEKLSSHHARRGSGVMTVTTDSVGMSLLALPPHGVPMHQDKYHNSQFPVLETSQESQEEDIGYHTQRGGILLQPMLPQSGSTLEDSSNNSRNYVP